MKTIFVVDDSDTNLSMAETALEEHYMVMTMPSAEKMFSLIEKIVPDMILLDIEMPEMDGFTALAKLKSIPSLAGIPVMFLTGRTDAEGEARGFEMGAVDFLSKPFSTPVLLNRIKTHLGIDGLIRQRTAQVVKMQNGVISVLSEMVETRDKRTGWHIERTSEYMRILINEMKESGVYTDKISEWDVEEMISSARMHDLGKIAISDLILNKPGKLTPEEYEEVKTHVHEGVRIIDKIIARVGDGEFLQNAKLFAANHHERWDGQGYPQGLKGEEIPLQGRLMAIVDVYDALSSVRPYKEAFPEEETFNIIIEQSGLAFDPKLVDVFCKAREKFNDVRIKGQEEKL